MANLHFVETAIILESNDGLKITETELETEEVRERKKGTAQRFFILKNLNIRFPEKTG
jgi:hypothetical protein